MKILFINPPSQEVYGKLKAHAQIPLGLAYVAAAAEQAGFEAAVMDIEAEKLDEDDWEMKIRDFAPEIIGITCTTPVYPSAVKICGRIKNISKEIVTVIGGVHPTIAPDDAIKPGSIDFLVAGEGENTIVELLKALQNKSDISSVAGVVYKKDNRIISNKPRELIGGLDSIPFPARHLFKNQKYTYPDSLSANTSPIITSRGCPGACTYCNTQNMFGSKFRARTAKNVVDEIESLVMKYGAREIHVWDDNFTTIKERVFEIRDELKERNIKVKFAFPNGVRADFLSPEVIAALKDMGVYSVAIGVESGVQEILDRAHKGIRLDRVVPVFEMLKRQNIETWAFFLFGLPGETEATIKRTIDFALSLNPDIAKFHILKPFPGTPVFREFKEKNLIICEDLGSYGLHTGPVHKLENLEAPDIERLRKYAYRRFYLRPGKILQQIIRLKSWNRAKSNISAAINIFRSMCS